MTFRGKRVLVTGGTRGIGKHIVDAFEERNAFVRATDSKTGDVRNVANYNNISYDIVINNAAIFTDAMAHKMTDEQWKDALDVNLTGAFNVTRSVLPYMRKMRWGRIINISSVVGQTGAIGCSNYAASKAGLIGFTKAVAQENARHGITVNAVALGYISEGMGERLSDELQVEFASRIPMHRFGTPKEVVGVILFLAGNDSSYITGQTINVNGGLHG